MSYKCFEELPCWKKARELCQAVFKIINQGKFATDFGLRDQIWRAAGSVMDNISEVNGGHYVASLIMLSV